MMIFLYVVCVVVTTISSSPMIAVACRQPQKVRAGVLDKRDSFIHFQVFPRLLNHEQ